MKARFEMELREDQRQQLGTLARELDMPVAGLLRLGAQWVLSNRELLLTGRAPRPPAEGTAQ